MPLYLGDVHLYRARLFRDRAALAKARSLIDRMPDLRLFISYRRDDASGDAGRLYDRLASRFGETQVFMDTEAIAGGEHFSDHIAHALASSNFILAVIGPRWLDVRGRDGNPRLRNARDVVRQELRIGLENNGP